MNLLPELPDITLYVEALQGRLQGQPLVRIRLTSPFLLRTVEPPLATLQGQTIQGVKRQGKRIVLTFPGDVHLVLHLMIAGRLHWKKPNAPVGGRSGLAAFDFPAGTLLLSEASSKKRAALHVLRGPDLPTLDRGGLEPLHATLPAFKDALTRENHTLKRALTDPRLLSGIGNAYSDEILHRARLSPMQWTTRLDPTELKRLHHATQDVLQEWIHRLRDETGDAFPENVTAFRPGMAVHGRHDQPCPVCASPVQRIRYAENECNYCATCQTGGKLLADRALSRLLKGDWPKTLDELERRREGPTP